MRSDLLVIFTVAWLAATAHADPAAAGAPPELKAFGCRDDGANRSCLECTPDTTGGTFCERCTRQPDAQPLSCVLPDAADLGVLSSSGIVPSTNIMPTWRPKPALKLLGCTGGSCLECESDRNGGVFCERCTRQQPDDELVGLCTLGDADRSLLDANHLKTSTVRGWPRWQPWHAPKPSVPPPAIAAGALPGITEYRCDFLASYNQRVCQECTTDHVCTRVLRDATGKAISTFQLEPSEVTSLVSHGVIVANRIAQVDTPRPPPPPTPSSITKTEATQLPDGRSRICQTVIVDGVAQAPTCTESGGGPPPAPPPAVAYESRSRSRGFSFGLELGHIAPDDGKNIYGAGFGRGYVLGYSIFELRLETYDLPDQTKTYDNVDLANGRLSIYSLAARPTLKRVGPIEVTVLAGLAVLSRPSLAMDPTDILTVAQLHDQYGAALVVGGGVRIFDVLTIDLRGYLTSWQAMSGMRAEMGDTGALTYVPVTDGGGLPITLNAGVGLAF